MGKSIIVSEVINLLDITLGDIPYKEADKIVMTCIRLLKQEYEKIIGE